MATMIQTAAGTMEATSSVEDLGNTLSTLIARQRELLSRYSLPASLTIELTQLQDTAQQEAERIMSRQPILDLEGD